MLDALHAIACSIATSLQPQRDARRRSPHWRTVRAAHLIQEPRCQACGRKEHLEVHHIQAFADAPHLELVSDNLITLCDAGDGGCHIRWGHLMDWQTTNPTVRADCVAYYRRVVETIRNGAHPTAVVERSQQIEFV